MKDLSWFFIVPLITFVASHPENKGTEKLYFEVVASRSIEEAPTIQVTFADGRKDALELNHYKHNEKSSIGCNYIGTLRNDPTSSVAVSGCLNKPGDKMEVTMISDYSKNQMFMVDFNGNAEVIHNPFAIGARSIAVSGDDEEDDDGWQKYDGDEMINNQEEVAARRARVVFVPPKLKATIQFGYETSMKSALPADQDFDSWIAATFVHTQAHFKHPSLGTMIEFEVIGDSIYNEYATWNADNNLRDAKTATIQRGTQADVFSWFCNRGGTDGVAGIAYLGGLCNSRNVNLNEKQSTSAASGFILAHELGHNFGMYHDFDPRHAGKGCDGTGIMSYGSYDHQQWSKCSKSDWEHHFSSKNWGSSCLEDISGFCLTYKTRSTPHAGTLGTAKVSITTDSGCAVNFVLSGKKNKGEEITVCDKTCPDGNLENAVVKIQQKSYDGWGIEHIKIKDIYGNRSPYSLDGKVMQFWVDGNKNGNYDGLSKCTWGKWCDLYKIEYAFKKKWDGFCFDGQQNTGTKLVGQITDEECKERCMGQESCIGYVYNPFNICYITSDHETISQWTSSTHLLYTCNEKFISPRYEKQWQGMCYDGQQSTISKIKTPEQCRNDCSGRASCIGYVSHPGNICLFTEEDQTISPWTTQGYLRYTCYKKV